MINTFNFQNWSEFDQMYAQTEISLGFQFLNNQFVLNFWQPIALKVNLLIFDKTDFDQLVQIFPMQKQGVIWTINLPQSFEGFYYQLEITHANNEVTVALDPYAKALAPFNWKKQTNQVGKGAIINLENLLTQKVI